MIVLLAYLFVFLLQILYLVIEASDYTFVLVIFFPVCGLYLFDSILQLLLGIVDLSIFFPGHVEELIIFLLNYSFKVKSQSISLLLKCLLLPLRIFGHYLALAGLVIDDFLQFADLCFSLLFVFLVADLEESDLLLFLVALNYQFVICSPYVEDHIFQASHLLLQKLEIIEVLEVTGCQSAKRGR